MLELSVTALDHRTMSVTLGKSAELAAIAEARHGELMSKTHEDVKGAG